MSQKKLLFSIKLPILLFLFLLASSFLTGCHYEDISTIDQESSIVPKGYTLDSYYIEKPLEDVSCQVDGDCLLPLEYAVRSNCPYYSKCLENKCAVVCPDFIK